MFNVDLRSIYVKDNCCVACLVVTAFGRWQQHLVSELVVVVKRRIPSSMRLIKTRNAVINHGAASQ